MEGLLALKAIIEAAELGFVPAKECILPQKMQNHSCDGATKLRDSIAVGIKLMLNLNKSFREAGLSSKGNYNFLHIVLTDGSDNSSKTKMEDLAAIFLILG